MQYPSIGRMVHYYLTLEDAEAIDAPDHHRTEPYAGVVTRVHDANLIDLDIHLKPGDKRGQVRPMRVVYRDDPQSGCWRWPPRVDVEDYESTQPQHSPSCERMVWASDGTDPPPAG